MLEILAVIIPWVEETCSDNGDAVFRDLQVLDEMILECQQGKDWTKFRYFRVPRMRLAHVYEESVLVFAICCVSGFYRYIDRATDNMPSWMERDEVQASIITMVCEENIKPSTFVATLQILLRKGLALTTSSFIPSTSVAYLYS